MLMLFLPRYFRKLSGQIRHVYLLFMLIIYYYANCTAICLLLISCTRNILKAIYKVSVIFTFGRSGGLTRQRSEPTLTHIPGQQFFLINSVKKHDLGPV